MRVKIFILIATVLFIQYSLFAQTENLPVIKANSDQVNIKEDGVLSCSTWYIMPEIEVDVWKTIAKEVTFLTDIDSITFTINPKEKTYDFIILLNGKDSARTQIRYEKPSQDIKKRFANSFDFFTTIATNKPENFDPRAINQGFRHSISYLIPFGKSKFSLGIGAGISFNNYYIDALPKDMLPASMQLEEYGEDFYFVKIASISDPKISYQKNKMTLTYLDIPLELRYCSKKGFKVSAGAKVDFLVGSHFKYKGSDFLFGTDEKIKIKKYHLSHLSNYQVGPIVRVGWKIFSAYATYSFAPVYDKDAGSKLNPICVGISFTPLY
jgi:hypothetical protein